MATVDAFSQAIQAVAGTITSGINAAAQRYGLTKGIEAEGVSFERGKTTALYQLALNNSKGEMMILVSAVVAVIVILALLIFKRK